MAYNVPHTLFGRPFRASLMMSSLTPHSALLHVGLKSLIPTGLLRNISE
ncbi:hypothetical protein Barb6_02410 [Bacteroidales bacterium Barb6]|nr:hypothetical protein Barb6_02410 [Bacteroidales bacterium Barb6]